jgi:hypothetical protein
MINQNNPMIFSYLETLKNRLFKIIPLFEENNEGIYKYIDSLLFELGGMIYVVKELKNNSMFLSLIATLESLLDESLAGEYNIPLVRREVFRCLNIVEKLQQKAGE